MSKMSTKFKTFRERNKKSNGYLLRKKSSEIAYKIVRFVLFGWLGEKTRDFCQKR